MSAHGKPPSAVSTPRASSTRIIKHVALVHSDAEPADTQPHLPHQHQHQHQQQQLSNRLKFSLDLDADAAAGGATPSLKYFKLRPKEPLNSKPSLGSSVPNSHSFLDLDSKPISALSLGLSKTASKSNDHTTSAEKDHSSGKLTETDVDASFKSREDERLEKGVLIPGSTEQFSATFHNHMPRISQIADPDFQSATLNEEMNQMDASRDNANPSVAETSHLSIPTSRTQQRGVSFDASVFSRRLPNPSSGHGSDQLSTSPEQDNAYNEQMTHSDPDSDSDSGDEGQIFQTHLSVRVPASTAANNSSHSTGSSPTRIILKDPRKPSNVDGTLGMKVTTTAINSPRSPLRRDSMGGNTSPFGRTPSGVGITESARKPSFPSLGRATIGHSTSRPSTEIRPPIRNVSFGDVASLHRQFHQPPGSQDTASSFIHNNNRSSSPFPGSVSSSWKLGSSVGSFRRNLSGVHVKRKDSVASTASGGMMSASSSFVAPSPAMSYLSMLAEKLAEPPRGVYFEGDQVGDWILGKEIGSGAFSRVFEASPAAESELGQALPPSTRAAIKIVAKAAPDSTRGLKDSRQDSLASLDSIGSSAGNGSGNFGVNSPASSNANNDGKAGQDDVRRLLDHEIAIWSSLDHPNILGLIQSMDVDDAVFVVSEFAEGGTLLDYIAKNGRLCEPIARKICKQLVEALLHLHTICQVIHRDIKCENILLMEAGPPADCVNVNEWVPTVKLADFGLSERISDSMLQSPTTLISSDPIFCVGSLHYCAPEELRATASTTNTAGDVWSMGCVFYTMLAGALPFNDDYLPRLQMSIMNGSYDESRLEKYQVSEKAQSLLKGMLTVDVAKRLTAQQVWEHPFFE
ncbi:kinase-like domain-containing protein [Obelidium mucronatum]|nr:kinase-like domain-containing protein [Obelidium mucronatum]